MTEGNVENRVADEISENKAAFLVSCAVARKSWRETAQIAKTIMAITINAEGFWQVVDEVAKTLRREGSLRSHWAYLRGAGFNPMIPQVRETVNVTVEEYRKTCSVVRAMVVAWFHDLHADPSFQLVSLVTKDCWVGGYHIIQAFNRLSQNADTDLNETALLEGIESGFGWDLSEEQPVQGAAVREGAGEGGSKGKGQEDPVRPPIEDLDLKVRTYNPLKRAGIRCIDEVLQMDKYNLLDTRNFGSKCLEDLEDRLRANGYHASWMKGEDESAEPDPNPRVSEDDTYEDDISLGLSSDD